ncbi:hypothetical protein [Microbacterium sp. MPKO10]|uniref:hypothetical protein n=1 Tax=Microbacterium sp. MPKO10 TaxID=2989818 RepID=UPI002236BA1C|nr:hypothetical protein [Microbacterium sp. MPKO10]MCW4456710.1 hypothetical protein [Microbacterium sp. MPKO10]
MTDTAGFLREEAEHAEANKDAPERAGTVATRPGGARARVYSIRLTEAEVAALEVVAEREGVPASTLARTWIVERLSTDGDVDDVHVIADALATFSQRLAAL